MRRPSCYAVSAAEALGAEKSQYWLFNPTPDKLLREMTTDRPDITESPFTVDAGHVQFETTLVGYTRSAPNQERAITDEFDFLTTNMRIGITNSAEIDLVWQPYGTVRTRQADPFRIFHQSGIGGLNLRAKVNLWGNDSSKNPARPRSHFCPLSAYPPIATMESVQSSSRAASSYHSRSSSPKSGRSP